MHGRARPPTAAPETAFMGKFGKKDGKGRLIARMEVIEGQLKAMFAMLNQMDTRAANQGVLILAMGEKLGGEKELDPYIKAAWEKSTGQHVPSVPKFEQPEPPVPGMGLPLEAVTEDEMVEDIDDQPEAGHAEG
jgi:hypothetical protein